MTFRRLIIAVVLVVSTAASAQDQNSVVPAGELIHAVVANELRDRVQQLKWMYVIEKRVGSQSLTEEQVETKNGPVYRVLAMDGIPMTPDQRQQDNARIDRLLHDTSQQSKLKQQYDDDEQKLEKLMRVMPDAFLYDYDGVDGDFVRLKFRPDPSYKPRTMKPGWCTALPEQF
jgi:hypothetical protein